MGKKSNIDKLREFKKRLSREMPLERMILFGSRARGRASRYSDFDIMIVSKKFRNVESMDRPLGFYKYWDLDYPVDFLCYTPEEFNRLKNMITLVREAAREGVEI